MGAKRTAFAARLGCIGLLGLASMAVGQEKRVVDQLLDILRQNKQISDQQYRELKQKAEEERQEERRKAVAPPPAPAVAPAPVAAAPPPTAPTPSPDTMRAYYKNGFILETADGKFKAAFGALTQLDWNISALNSPVGKAFTPNLHSTYTGVEFRRARLCLPGWSSGTSTTNSSTTLPRTLAVNPRSRMSTSGMSQIPVLQYVRVGYFKEPFSLEELTSDWITTFQERGRRTPSINRIATSASPLIRRSSTST